MIIKLKEQGLLGSRRSLNRGEIDNIVVREDILNPEKEHINLFFKGHDCSGIVQFTREEVESLINSVKPTLQLIGERKFISPGRKKRQKSLK